MVARRRDRQRRHQEQRAAATPRDPRTDPALTACLRATADAELRGDPAAALQAYETVPAFRDSLHDLRLRLLTELGDLAPGWMHSRWATVQAHRHVWTGAGSSSADPAMQETVEAVYLDVGGASLPSDMPADLFALSLYQRDWVFRQRALYDHGRLRVLAEELAGPRLLEHADHLREWCDAPIGGYRFDSEERGHLQLTDLADGRTCDVLDLGLGMEHAPGTHLLGRLVPVDAPPGRMFEWRPLAVDAATARRVARRPDSWLEILAEHAHRGLLPPMFSYQEDTSMLFDLPSDFWMLLLDRERIDQLPVTDGQVERVDVGLAVLRRVLQVAEHLPGSLPAVRVVAEGLLLEPGLFEVALRRFGGRRFARAWWTLGQAVREPVRSRCLELAATRYDDRGPFDSAA